MLLVLLYHRVGTGKYANPLPRLEEHLAWISKNYPVVIPGDPLLFSPLQVCLTFDDASFDFYYQIYPLLKKYDLKGVLGVPVRYILERTSEDPSSRLKKEILFKTPSSAFCTWEEMREMARSGHVHFASHTLSHCDLTQDFSLEEITTSKHILESKLGRTISTFIYPYGRFNRKIHTKIKPYYPYIMRIGNAYNLSWNNRNQLIYRVNADALPSLHSPFRLSQRGGYGCQLLWNLLRNR